MDDLQPGSMGMLHHIVVRREFVKSVLSHWYADEQPPWSCATALGWHLGQRRMSTGTSCSDPRCKENIQQDIDRGSLCNFVLARGFCFCRIYQIVADAVNFVPIGVVLVR